jgi:hypothetical protein
VNVGIFHFPRKERDAHKEFLGEPLRPSHDFLRGLCVNLPPDGLIG